MAVIRRLMAGVFTYLVIYGFLRLSEIKKSKTISNRGWAISRIFILLFNKVYAAYFAHSR